MSSETAHADGLVRIDGPYLIELDEESWNRQLDSAQAWLGNVITAQSAFRKLVEASVPKIEKPNVRLYLTEILETARRHERLAHDLFKPIGREPTTGRQAAGSAVAAARRVMGTVEGLAGGAAGNWRDVRELLIANLDAMGAFAVAEQIGLALALHDLRDLAFSVTQEKSSDQLVLQEIMLEMASASILYKEQV